MKLVNTILLSASLVTGSVALSTANASIMELITNGEFENPLVTNGSGWQIFSNGACDFNNTQECWGNTSGGLELWREGAIGSPSLGSDGNPTGQHHEVPNNSVNNITYQITGPIGSDPNILNFSFDTWRRGAQGIEWFIQNRFQGTIASGNHFFTSNLWESVEIFGVRTNQCLLSPSLCDVRVGFRSIGGGSSGAHIDQVSLQSVPEPSVLILFALGLVGLGFAGHRRVKGGQ